MPAQAGIHDAPPSAQRIPYFHIKRRRRYGQGAWVYLITNRPHGILYAGVTSHLIQRMHQHRTGTFEGFSKRHALHRLVWAGQFATMPEAIAFEKTLKHWNRAWKARLILEQNPLWEDLSTDLLP